MQQSDTGIRDGDESKKQRISFRVLRMSTVQSQASLTDFFSAIR